MLSTCGRVRPPANAPLIMDRESQFSSKTISAPPIMPTYRRLAVTVRPPRVATVIPATDDWVSSAQRMMENYSAIWGGRGNVLVPCPDSGELTPAVWRLLERFDADRFGYYLPTLRGMQLSDPAGFERWLDNQASEWSARHPGTSREEARQQLVAPHILSSPLTTWRPPSSLVEEVQRRLAPLDRTGPFELVWSADGEPGGELLEVTNIRQTGGHRLFIFRASGADPRLDLMLTSLLGAIAPSYRAKLEQMNVAIANAEVTEEQIGFLLAALWSASPGDYVARQLQFQRAMSADSALPWNAADFDHTPFALTRLGCTSYVIGKPWTYQLPEVVVVGDTAADYCMYLALERMYSRAIWVPLCFLTGTDGLGNVVAQQLAEHLHRITGFGAAGGHAVVTSNSLGLVDFPDLTDRIFHGDPLKANILTHVDWVAPSDLVLPKPLRLYDSEHVVRQNYEPFLEQDMAGTLQTPTPTGVTEVTARRFTWHVDVAIDDTHFPPRSCLNRLMAVQTDRERDSVRASSDGISYFSLEPFFIPAGASVEQALYRPRLRLASGLEIFQELFRASGLRGATSQAGRFSQGCIDLWGGLDALAADLADPARLALLEAYRRSTKSAKDPGVYLQGVRRRFLSYWDVRRATGLPADKARSLLDEYVGRGILARGLCLKCPRCSFAGWYDAADISQSFACGRCRHRSSVTAETWMKPPSEPIGFYQLDELAYQALDHDVRAPVLALAHVKRSSRSFLYAPEMLIFRGPKRLCEVDLCMISESAIIVGEAKISDRLADSEDEERLLVEKLTVVAQASTAHEIVLATLRPSWSARTRRVVTEIVSSDQYHVRWLEGLGGTVLDTA